MSGAVQLTERLVSEAVETTGAAGLSGGSFTSVREIVTVMVALFMFESVAFTVTP